MNLWPWHGWGLTEILSRPRINLECVEDPLESESASHHEHRSPSKIYLWDNNWGHDSQSLVLLPADSYGIDVFWFHWCLYFFSKYCAWSIYWTNSNDPDCYRNPKSSSGYSHPYIILPSHPLVLTRPCHLCGTQWKTRYSDRLKSINKMLWGTHSRRSM